ncbi:MAG TPA: AMP-binding protein [Blastocatellia bacterium]|nr:AMP-binding protein [Blastocatellia bacterium]
MREVHFYNRELETSDRGRLSELTNEKLRRLLAQLSTNEFYQAKFKAAGIDAQDIRGAKDLSPLPFTTKRELAEDQRARPPFGRLPTYPLRRYRYFHRTSGTTASPLKWLDTEESWRWWLDCWGYVYRAAGVTEHDIVFCAFSFGPYISHWAGIAGAWHAGAMCISGGGMNSEQRLHTMLDNKCTVLVCTPTYALHLAEVARSRGIDLRSSALRVSVHAGEPGASVPSVKRLIEDSFGTACFDHAGATEVGAWAFDCGTQTGAIHLNELEFIFEVINRDTCEPAAEGECGELVITNLGRAGMPVLRYRSGDLVEMTSEPCPCGRKLARIRGGVLGRADDMLIVRGVNVYPSTIDNLIRNIPQIVEYEVEIRRVSGMDDLLIKIETADAQPFESVRRMVLEAFRAQLNIRVSVEPAAPASLPRYEFKARRYKRIAD